MIQTLLGVTLVLGCAVPAGLHPVCDEAIALYAEGSTDVDHVIFVCNMVSSANIPMVECIYTADRAD